MVVRQWRHRNASIGEKWAADDLGLLLETVSVESLDLLNRVKTVLIRTFKATEGSQTLTTPPMTIGGVVQTTVLNWKRAP